MSYPMRRVTIPTVKMDETIQFYHDVFGMTVFYDQLMEPVAGSPSLLGPEGDHPHRLVSLQQGDSVIGMMGLIDYRQPELNIRPFEKKPGSVFPLIVVFTVDDLAAVADKVRKTGCPIIGQARKWEIPGKGMGAGMSFVDPNGVLVELTQLPERDPQQKGPVSCLRRVTVPIVRGKMPETIRFYQEVFGLSVFYDGIVATPPGESMLGLPEAVETRIVSMAQGDTRYGMAGFLEYLEPDVQWQPFTKKAGYPYEVIFVFMVDEMDKVITKAKELGGRLLARKTYEIPQRGKADGVMLADPNGVVIDLTQFI
jgi:predicted enzyme related to lactoylglutathione lyase